jgi:hypothetical protein
VWNTYELQHKLQRGVGLGFGARHYTDQPGDLLNTFSIAAYGLMDACTFYRRGQLGRQIYPIIWATSVPCERAAEGFDVDRVKYRS